MEALDDSTVYGTLYNPGEIHLFNTAIGARVDEKGGHIGNTFTLIATGKTQVAGLISNAATGDARFTGEGSELTILDGGVVSNNGELRADSLVVNAGGRSSTVTKISRHLPFLLCVARHWPARLKER